KVVHEVPFDNVERDLLFYQEGAKVFMYDEVNGQFMLLFDYAKQAGEQYDIVAGAETYNFLVDSVTTTTLLGDNIQVQHGRIPHPQDPNEPFLQAGNKVYEGIGTEIGLWPKLPTLVTPEIWHYLVCALKPDGKLYSLNPFLDVDCQALATPTSQRPETQTELVIFPNPTTDYLHITVQSSQPIGKAKFLVFNGNGMCVKAFKLADLSSTFILPVWSWPSGAYWLQVVVDGEPILLKEFIKN
ncbi:MAG: T9SS type A sorting domain-containing protein, partial [Saprospiraceae bacterium]|nr:T9SS type A sorting domain-containing protein [Saprospiraceae bacterium]